VAWSGAALVAIVDDDLAVREAMSSLLRSAGYRCAIFDSAETFLATGSLRDVRCMLLDVRMPGMSGLDLHRMMRRMSCEIPVIYVSAAHDAGSRERALAQGAVAFLTKAFADEDLLRAIGTALKDSGAERSGMPGNPS
jgi:two-component system, LuxR family, response regulator FixJ